MLNPPRKRFGQHFLHDANILNRIVAAIAPQPDDDLVEIGPGRGALTERLLPRLNHLHAVELDRDLVSWLTGLAPAEKLTIHSADALRFDFRALARAPGTLRIVGNLPYNISTPLLFHLLDQAEAIRDMHFLLQKEVVDRLTASPGSASYGRLSVMLRTRADAIDLFPVGPGAFNPPPRVQSALVRITPCIPPRVSDEASGAFTELVRLAFSHRRKTLRRSLAGKLSAEAIMACGVDPQTRPETLDVDAFLRLALASMEATAATGEP
jgi:16S rRNA (adenine1518-N6/adenine1519-N6)-dimethyltransferase